MSFIHILYLIRTYMQMIKSLGKYYFSYRKFWKFYIDRICETGAFIKCISLCSCFSASIKIYDQSLSFGVKKTHVLLTFIECQNSIDHWIYIQDSKNLRCQDRSNSYNKFKIQRRMKF